MKMSTRSRYGLRLLLDLALNGEKGPVQLSSIARAQNLSEKYLGQLVIQLKSSGLVRSERGKSGGYFLSRSPREITLREIVEKLEGDLSIVECVNNPEDCDRSDFCITRDVWSEISRMIIEKLEQITLDELAQRVRNTGHTGIA